VAAFVVNLQYYLPIAGGKIWARDLLETGRQHRRAPPPANLGASSSRKLLTELFAARSSPANRASLVDPPVRGGVEVKAEQSSFSTFSTGTSSRLVGPRARRERLRRGHL
jgi:hypothetical protein